MADPEHPPTRLLRGELWTWSDDRTSPRRGWGGKGRVSAETSCLPPQSASLPSSLFLPALSSAVYRWLRAARIRENSEQGVGGGAEVMDGAAGDMGRGRINIREKEKGDFHFCI